MQCRTGAGEFRNVSCERIGRSASSDVQEAGDDEKVKIITWGLNSQAKSRLDALSELAKQSESIMLPSTELDSSSFLLGVSNGTVDLRTGCLLAPERDRFISKSTAVAYQKNAECPRWEEFLSEITNSDAELVQFLQRLAGYALWGGNPEQVVVILHGWGSNGKSLGMHEEVDCVIDDHPKKNELVMPGSHLPIVPSSELHERSIKICISTLSPESEVKVKNKLPDYFSSGGIFIPASIAQS
mgnify:CR=1 FL=1